MNKGFERRCWIRLSPIHSQQAIPRRAYPILRATRSRKAFDQTTQPGSLPMRMCCLHSIQRGGWFRPLSPESIRTINCSCGSPFRWIYLQNWEVKQVCFTRQTLSIHLAPVAFLGTSKLHCLRSEVQSTDSRAFRSGTCKALRGRKTY